MYAALARRIHGTRDTQEAVEIIRELKRKLRDRVPSIDQIKAVLPEVVYTDNLTRQRKLVKYILIGLHQATPSPITVDYEQMTIEHLAPQSRIGQPGFDEGVIGQIGNLLLISPELNGKLKNRPFDEKKQLLIESGLSVPTEIRDASTWGPDEIRQRTMNLADAAYNSVWKI